VLRYYLVESLLTDVDFASVCSFRWVERPLCASLTYPRLEKFFASVTDQVMKDWRNLENSILLQNG